MKKNSQINLPKITIITVCYNSEKTIKDTLESVLSQSFDDYEHLIIDGNSKDNTLKIIKDYERKYNGKLRVISEKDKGLYDAMNKGIKNAKGNIIGILNSDDIFATKDVLKTIYETFEKENCQGIYGNLEFRDNETMTKVVRNWNSKKGNYKLGWHPPHPTLYLKREVYDKIGNFNLDYRICADYDFMLRMMKNNINLYYIKSVLIHMRSGGVSTNGLKGYINNFKESYLVLKKNKIKIPLGVNIIRTIKTIFQMIF